MDRRVAVLAALPAEGDRAVALDVLGHRLVPIRPPEPRAGLLWPTFRWALPHSMRQARAVHVRCVEVGAVLVQQLHRVEVALPRRIEGGRPPFGGPRVDGGARAKQHAKMLDAA